jgi:MoxR-like ATPase
MNGSSEREFLSIIRRYMSEGTVFQSPVQGARYRITAVDDSGCEVDRIDANEPARVTVNTYRSSLEKVRGNGGSYQFNQLVDTVAVRTTVLQALPFGLSPDKQTILDLSEEEKAIQALSDVVQNLRVHTSGGQPTLYKPAMLACVIEGLDAGELTSNAIEFDWIVPRFIRKMKALGVEVGADQAAMPFFHLTGDLFWMLSYKNTDDVLETGTVRPSTIRQRVSHAVIKDTFWHVLENPEGRKEALKILEDRWWSSTSNSTEVNDIHDSLEKILAKYASARLNERFGRQNELWGIFESLQRTLATSKVVTKKPNINVTWSVGRGNWAEVPWISFLDNRVTDTTRRGIYCVFLFRQDMSGVYLTFNQGVTEPQEQYGRAEGIRVLKTRAQSLRNQCGELVKFGFNLDDDIDLRSDRGLGTDYERSTIAYKLYETGSVPEDSQILLDIEAVLNAYERYIAADVELEPTEDEIHYWQIAPGEQARLWNDLLANSIAAVGWDKLNIDLKDMSREELNEHYKSKYPDDSEFQVKLGMKQLWDFVNIQPGDRFVTNKGKSLILGCGVVRGGYRFRPERKEYEHTLEVDYYRVSDVGIQIPEDLKGKFGRTIVPLSKEEFETLEELFEPVEERSWIFQANPDIYDLSGALDELSEINWTVRQHADDIHAGDKVFLWESGPNAGVLAKAEVLTEPATLSEDEREKKFYVDEEKFEETSPRVRLRIELVFPDRIRRETLQGHPVLSSLSILRAPQGTNFPVTPEQAMALEELIPEIDIAPVEADLEATHSAFSEALKANNISFGPRHEDVVRSFIASLATKRFVILTGLSGSGKTQIAVKFGEWLGEGNSLVVPVRPDWTGSEALFGYEDALQPLVDGRKAWHVPGVLEFILKAARDPQNPYLIVLDEMNLAHVERYFADVLSGMESMHDCVPNLRVEDGYWRLVPGGIEKIPYPNNLFIVGTVNVDETTYMFSPKVLDRANTFEFRVDTADLSENVRKPTKCETGDHSLIKGLLAIAKDDNWHLENPASGLNTFIEHLRSLHKLLAGDGFEFGHRVFYEAMRFAAMYSAAGDDDPEHALDLQIMQKVLPRLHGSRRRIEPILCALGQFCFDLTVGTDPGSTEGKLRFDPLAPPEGAPRLAISFDKICRMTRSLRANQFVSFTE